MDGFTYQSDGVQPLCVFHATDWSQLPFPNNLGGDVNSVKKSGRLVEKCDDVYPSDAFEHSRHGAPRPGDGCMTDVNVPLHCQCQSQPDGCSVEKVWNRLRTKYYTISL